jgi:TonB-dependent receptor
MLKYSIFLFLFFISNLSFSQNTLFGKIIASNDNEVLVGASIVIDSTGLGAKTNLDGKFTISNIPNGTYSITVKYIGFQTKKIDSILLTNATKQELNLTLDKTSKKIKEVTIKTSIKRESLNSLISQQRNNITISDGVSAEQIKKSPDRNVSDVLKRASGLSIQGDKYAVIRGMDGRYVSSMINGILMPSTEPDKKAFSFDILPSSLIDNVIITKAAIPELTGDFAGGIINVNMKDIVDENFVSITGGTGFNTQTYGKVYNTYEGGNLDMLGLVSSSRKLPAAFPTSAAFTNIASNDVKRYEYSKLLNTTWDYKSNNSAPLNSNFQIATGFTTKLFKQKLGGILSATYNNNYRTIAQENNYWSLDSSSSYKYNDKIHSQKTLVGLLGNFTYNLNKSNKISFKNIYSINSNNQTTLRTGTIIDLDNVIKRHELFFISNTLLNSQLSGDHAIEKYKIKVKWNLSYSDVKQQMPDRRLVEYSYSPSNDTIFRNPVSSVVSPLINGRTFTDLKEKSYSGKLDFHLTKKLLNYDTKIKFGTYYQLRDRSFSARNIAMVASSINTFSQDMTVNPTKLFDTSNINKNGFVLGESTNGSDRYLSNATLVAGYVQAENDISTKLKLVWGLRIEDFSQNLYSSDYTLDTVIVNNKNTDFLPSAVLTYSPSKKVNIRFCASQTVVRPEFRELAPVLIYDFERNAYLQGNPNVKRTKINNAEIRYEYYPSAGEVFTAGVFYKYFNNPIQAQAGVVAAGINNITNVNYARATNIGAEFEVRKKLDFIKIVSFFKDISIFSNTTFIKSNVVKNDSSKIKSNNEPLVNQSPWLFNAGIAYNNPKYGSGITVLFNRYTHRLNTIGNEINLNLWEHARSVLDIQFSQRFAKNGEVKLNIGDILNQPNVFYFNRDEKTRYNSKVDNTIFNRKLGANVSLGVSYKL